jgi:hypothetical protein
MGHMLMTTTGGRGAAGGRPVLVTAVAALVLAGAQALPARAADAARPNLSGAWQLNPELTDRLMKKQIGDTSGETGKESGHGRHQGGGMDALGGGPQGDAGITPKKPAPEHEKGPKELGTTFALRDRFTIAQDGDQLVLNDGQGGSMTVKADGKRVRAAGAPGGALDVRASWEKDGTLRMEIKPDKGPRRTESYVVSNDHKHLYVTISALRVSGDTVQMIRAFDLAPSAEAKPDAAPPAAGTGAPPPGS